MQRIWDEGKHVIFDVDVVGGLNIKKKYPKKALSIFVMPPNIEELKKRLILRSTDSSEDIETRINKANEELAYADQFDIIIINNREYNVASRALGTPGFRIMCKNIPFSIFLRCNHCSHNRFKIFFFFQLNCIR